MAPGEDIVNYEDLSPLEEAELKVKQSVVDLYNALILESLMKISGSVDYLDPGYGYIKNPSGSTGYQTS